MAFCARVLISFGLIFGSLLLAASCAHAQDGATPALTQTSANEIFDPVGWAEEQAFYKNRQNQLLAHIEGARNIEVAKGWQGVAPWPINWDAQQKFCKPRRLTVAAPSMPAAI